MSKLGVIFTDTAVLADKYNCHRQEVLDVIGNYIHGCRNRGIYWQLVDVGGHDFDYIFSKSATWEDYRQALADNCAGMGWQTDCNTPLFIIGGDDVIPIPIIPEDKTILIPEGKGLQIDTLYCYPPKFDLQQELAQFLSNGYNKGELYGYFMAKAVFNVSRLPLERGDVPSDLHSDLGGYFAKSLASNGAITVDKMLPVSAFKWYFSTLKTVENMPLLDLGANNGCHMSNIFVSPLLRISRDPEDGPAMAEFNSALGKADMLMFNLHGGYDPNLTGFLGEGDVVTGYIGEGIPTYEHPLAFDIGLLDNCPKTKVLITEACYGARYVYTGKNVYTGEKEDIEYSRFQSMLLYALYNSGILLYAGSCETSPFDQPILSPGANVYNLRLISFADEWTRTYLDQQMQGVPAGLAMLRSKWLYYDESGNEKNSNTLFTILEFNQFGDPTLSVHAPDYKPVQAQQTVKTLFRRKAEKVLPHKEAYVPVYSKKTMPELDAAYADVRASVDAALLRLSDDLRRMLADDYHYPSHHLFLSSILREENSGGHLYVYAHEGRSDSERRVYVRVDAAGKVQKITYRM